MSGGWNRRRALKAFASGAACTGLPGVASAFGDTGQVDIGELDLGPGTIQRPNAWRRLLYEMEQTTSVECRESPVTLSLESDDLFEHPFLVLQGDGAFKMPNDAALEQLTRFLAYGGFLLCDDATGSSDSEFYASVTELLRRIFPTRPLGPLPRDHSIYRAYFLIGRPLGRLDRFDHLEAVTVGNLAPVVVCRNDLGGALDRSSNGQARNACIPGGELQRREALKLTMNLVMYGLTANYKRDISHVAELMKRGRLE